MIGPERRQSPRTPLQGFVYLKLGESNYGSVLNVSEGGLCFRSMVPAGKSGTVNFSFSESNRRIDGTGELIWVDEAQKTGGLRFTEMPAATRGLIENWIAAPSSTCSAEAAQTQMLPVFAMNSPLEREAAPPDRVLLPVRNRLQAELPPALRGFSGGLVTGVLVSSLIAGMVLFQSYRRELGESLIHLGQRFAAQAQTQEPAQVLAQPVAQAAQLPDPPPPVKTRVLEPQNSELQLVKSVSAPDLKQTANVEIPEVKRDPAPAPSVPASPPAVPALTAEAFVPPAPNSDSMSGLRASNTHAGDLPLLSAVPAAQPPAIVAAAAMPNPASATPYSSSAADLTDRASVQTEISKPPVPISTSELYCDVGKFKDPSQASDTIEKLSLLGFPATSVQKGYLWTNSYHVLVGPYDGTQEFKTARKSLSSRGFQPKPFEKGSRSFTLLSNLALNGSSMPLGDYTVNWESFVSEATVKFVKHNSVVASAEGRWVKRMRTYARDAYVYRSSGKGPKVLVEIQFSGMRQALVFGSSS